MSQEALGREVFAFKVLPAIRAAAALDNMGRGEAKV